MKTTRSARIEKLRKPMIETPAVCVERALYMTEAYKQWDYLPPTLVRAKAMENIFGKMTVRIDEEELLAGWPTSKARGGTLIVEQHSTWIVDELDTVQEREWERYQPLTEEEKRIIVEEIMPYWRGKTNFERWAGAIPEEYAKLENLIQSSGGYVRSGHHHAHVAANYPYILQNGMNATIRDLERRQSELDMSIPGNLERYNFYKAAIILQKAVINLANRYADLAESMANAEHNAARKKELLRIASNCRRVPAETPRTLYEAVQAIWLIYVCVLIEGWGAGMSLGRPDQYLLPYYERDIAAGVLTRPEAQEIMSCLLVKLNSAINLEEGFLAAAFAGYPVMCGLTIGGVTPEGNDAVNEMTYIILDAEEEVGLTAEDIVVRFNRRNPEKYCVRACEVARNLRGKLKFISDETTIQAMLYNDIPIAYARDYVSTGCHNPTVPALSHDGGGIVFDYVLPLELALNNGRLRKTGELIGLETGDPRKFRDIEEVMYAFERQYEYLLNISFLYKYEDLKLLAEYVPCTLISSFLDNCLETGTDVYNCGTAPYATHTTGLCGPANVGDSIAAVKKVVFDDKKVTMERLIDALDANFEGYEDVLYLLQKTPKFGNDDDYVDFILRDVLARSCDYSKGKSLYKGRKCSTACLGMTANIPFGGLLGATPDGRKAGEPLSEGGISPYQGRNTSGATSSLNSVAKLDQVKLSNGSIYNMRVTPGSVKDEKGLLNFTRMIRSFFEDGGNLAQFNFTDNETLRAAQKDPDSYRDLLVRVATYSSFFVEISPELQENIIARNELE